MDGVWIQIHDVDGHVGFDAIEVQRPHVFFHLGNNFAGFGFEGEFDVVGFRAISSFDVFLESKDGHLGVKFEFGDFEGGEVMLEVDFDKVFDHGGIKE